MIWYLILGTLKLDKLHIINRNSKMFTKYKVSQSHIYPRRT